MMFCRGCAKEIHESAQSCPSCGCIQNPTTISPINDGSIWIPIISMTLGIISTLALLDNSSWDKDTIVGLAIFSISGLVLGVISLNKQKTGKGMAIAGTVLSAIGMLCLIGLTV